MAKIDWNLHDTVLPEDMNALGSEINRQGTGISKLEDRLNIAEYEDITLQPGLQVINAKRDSRFRLGEIKGRTLINLLGDAGGCETLTSWTANGSIISLDSANYLYGSNSLKVTSNGAGTWGGSAWVQIALDKTKYYILLADVMNKDATAGYIMLEAKGVRNYDGNKISSTDKFSPSYIAISPNNMVNATSFCLHGLINSGSGCSAYFDGFRIYEITSADYAALNGMTADQIAANYPFVTSGIVGIENPYAISYGENLLPPFYEWGIHANLKVESQYKATLRANAAFHISNYKMSLPVGKTFTVSGEFSGDIGGYIHVRGYDSSDNLTTTLNTHTNQAQNGINSLTFTVPVDAKYVEFVFTSGKPGTYTLENPTLVNGFKVGKFKVQRKSMLAFKTELNANPTDGSDPDVLFEKEGQYFKLAKWKKVVLDWNHEWDIESVFSGVKRVRIGKDNPTIDGSSIFMQTYATKYDGKPLAINSSNPTEPDYLLRNPSNKILYLTVANADSGWGEVNKVTEFSGNGSTVKFTLPAIPTEFRLISTSVTAKVDNTTINITSVSGHDVTVATPPASGKVLVVNYKIAYVPTLDEMKAYFMGWIMVNADTWNSNIQLFDGSGTKGWVKRYVGVGIPFNTTTIGVFESGTGTRTLPTAVINSNWTPYQLIYRLAKETVESIASEGCLTFFEGDNMIEVGTGIVLRERANPSEYATYYYINNNHPNINSSLKWKASRILEIFRGSQKDTGRWSIYTGKDTYGLSEAYSMPGNYEKKASYFVTYVKLANLPTQSILGTMASNEKSQISYLNSGIAEALDGISALNLKKAEIDLPRWITPTLLNGYTNLGRDAVAYFKDGQGFVHLKGEFATIMLGSVAFMLPAGYRPKTVFYTGIRTYGSSGVTLGTLVIDSNGAVKVTAGQTVEGSLGQIVFLAEQ